MKTLEQLYNEHIEFTSKTFPKATVKSSIIHLRKEAKEVLDELNSENINKANLAIEYADMIGCMFDSVNRSGLKFEEIVLAFEVKLGINKLRRWKENPDGTYSHLKDIDEEKQTITSINI